MGPPQSSSLSQHPVNSQRVWPDSQQWAPRQGLLRQTLPQPDVSDPRQQVLPAQPLAGGSLTVAPH
jgi:hypothetical protein